MSTRLIAAFVALLALIIGIFWYSERNTQAGEPVDPTPKQVTLSGTYECLPHKDTTGAQTEECAFGVRTDAGEHYAVNFGQSAEAMDLFRSGAHIEAEGFVVPVEALSTNQWEKYDMKGIFTVTRMIKAARGNAPAGKIDIDAVCTGALAYMSFPNGAAADAFVAECKEGKHPEVIERYRGELGHDGAQI